MDSGKLKFNDVLKKSVISRQTTMIEWLCLGSILFFASITFLYADLTDTYENSILFLKAIYNGEFTRFYSYTIEHSRTFWAANYDFVIYLVYGIWNIPVLLLSYFTGIDYLDWAFGLFWCKSLGVILCLCIAFVIYKILLYVSVQRQYACLGAFLFLSSSALYTIVFVISQVDMFALLLLVLGFYYYLKEQNKRFFLCFIIAMPCKMFSMFLFIPLLLLKEKRICHVIGNIVLLFSANLLSKVLFSGDPAYSFALGSQSRDAIVRILESSLFVGQMLIPFILCYIGICVFCYLYEGWGKDSRNYQIPIYCAMAVWGCFVCFVNFNSYWAVYLIPFMILAIISSGHFLKVCCLLETTFSIGYFGVVLMNCDPLGDLELVRRLPFSKLVQLPDYDITKYGSLKYMAEKLGAEPYAPLMSTCMMASLLILLILTCPFLFKNVRIFEPLERTVLWARLGCMLAITMLLLYSHLKTVPPTVYSNLNEKGVACTQDLISTESWIGQEIQFDQPYSLEELQLFFYNPDFVRNNFSSVSVQIIHLNTEKAVFLKQIGCSMITSDERLDINLKNLKVESNTPYLIKITGIRGSQRDRSKGRSLYPYTTKKLMDKENPALINGTEQEFNLYYRIR